MTLYKTTLCIAVIKTYMKTIPEKQKKPFTVTVEDAVRGDGK